jgi:hypothetical protein
VQPVLIYGAKLQLQRVIQRLDNFLVALHGCPPCLAKITLKIAELNG